MSVGPALGGLEVVEVSRHVRGRYLGRLFGELGARVTRFAPAVDGDDGSDRDAAWLDAPKHRVTRFTAEEVVARLETADVLIEDGTLPDPAFDHVNASLVRVLVTPFGLDGPWAGREAPDLIISALSGMAGINGYADGVPLREPGVQAEMVGALMGFIGALAALEEREQSGLGQLVESSCMEALLNVLSPAVVQWSYTGKGPQRKERGADMLFRCSDGWMSLYITADRAWETIVSILEVPVAAGDDRFTTEAGRRKHAKEMRALVEPLIATRTRSELYHLLSPMRVVCGMVMEPKDLLEDEHLAARQAFAPAGDTGVRIPRIAIRSRGEDLAAAIRPSGIEPQPLQPPAATQLTAQRLPLEHILITDLTQAWAGAYATQLLADLGATVIKIESRRRPDPWRGGFGGERGLQAYPSDGPGVRPYNRMWLTNSVNRNKLGITLDLGDAECRELFLALVRRSDVVAENFTPRVMPNFGLDYERLRQEKADIIMLSMPGYGLEGPYSDFPAIGGTIEPMSGNAALLGEPGGLPQTSGLMYPDAVAGLHGAAAVLAALRRRASTGEGSHMEVAQHEAMLSMTAPFYVHDGWSAPAGNADPRGGDDRIEQAAENAWLATSGAHSALVRSIADVMCCEHLAARGFFVDVEQVDVGMQRMPGLAPRLHRTPGTVRSGSPGHGQHSRDVLRDYLGVSEADLDRLEAAGLIGAGPRPA